METLVISRAETDAPASETVASILERAGYAAILPQRDFADRSFTEPLRAALENGGRVIVLLSPEYLASDDCAAQWQSVLEDDPLNKKSRLIILRIAECSPRGLLEGLAYWDLVSVSDPHRFETIVLQAAHGGRSERLKSDVAARVPGPENRAANSGGFLGATPTFLFTDIEGSAECWERDPAAIQTALQHYNALVRTAIAEHGGRVFKTIGDMFCAAFARPEDALPAALTVQRRFAAAQLAAMDPLRVRMAIHTGKVEERNGDFFGPALNRVAHVLAVGYGGQVLLSDVTAQLVRVRLPPQTGLLDLGEHRLKNLTQPERLYQLLAPGLPDAFPPLHSSDAGRNNLPPTLTSFVGRDTQIADIVRLIDEHRFVTLVGAGGIGKTRTALKVGTEFQRTMEDGVWFVDLAPLGSAAYVVPEIAGVFNLREEHGRPLLATVIAHLRGKRLLLILDNCEHVVAEARDVAEALVRECASVAMLATSREPLAASAEFAHRLPTLDVPAAGALTAARAIGYEAIALFVARARSADARFALNDANASTVGDICRRLDGIALAIELAAARATTLGVAQISAKLTERFRLLTGGSRTALPRQQTLGALIDWSYDLLDADQQRLFRALSTFAGSWTLESATAVFGDDADEFTVLDNLTALADKSLVVVEFGDTNRFRFLESMRAYAFERARGENEVAELARRRAAFFAEFAGDGTIVGAAVVARVGAIEAEIENVREVLHWALDEGHAVELGARIAHALARFWSTRFPREGQRWMELAQARLSGSADRALKADIAIAVAAMLPHGSSERFEATERALLASREINDPHRLTRALAASGEQLSPLGRDVEAKAMFEEALQQARRVGSDWDAGRALAGLTTIAVDRAEIGAARDFGQQAISVFDAIGAIDGVAYVCIALGEAEFIAGNIERAFDLAHRARAEYGAVQNIRSCAGAANYLAVLALASEKVDDARTHARDTLGLLGTDHHPMFFNEAIGVLAHVATLRGDTKRGSLLFSYYEAARKAVTHPLTGCAQQCYERHRSMLTAAIGAEELARRIAGGAQLSEERALEEALAV